MLRVASNGKLVLGGEYAVVYGGKALAIPVGHAELVLEEGAEAQIQVQCEPFALCFSLAVDGDRVVSGCGDPVAENLTKNINSMLQVIDIKIENIESISLDTSDLYYGGRQKWGLGSSGVSLAMLGEALTHGRTWTTQEFREAMLAVSGSKGSGIDFAAAHARSPVVVQSGAVRQCSLRGGEAILMAAHDPRSTENEVQKFVAQHPADSKAVRYLRDLAAQTTTAYQICDHTTWIQSLQHFDDVLNDLAQEAGVDRTVPPEFAWDGWYVRACGAGGDSYLALPLQQAQQDSSAVLQQLHDRGTAARRVQF